MPTPLKTTAEQHTEKSMPGGIDVVRMVDGDEMKLGVATGDPGDKETWHEHKDEVEEIYYTLSGAGRIAWVDEDGEVELRIEAGEAVLLPKGGLYHEIEAVGEDGWTFVYAINAIDGDTYRK